MNATESRSVTSALEKLPPELQSLILKQLSSKSLTRLSATSKSQNAIVKPHGYLKYTPRQQVMKNGYAIHDALGEKIGFRLNKATVTCRNLKSGTNINGPVMLENAVRPHLRTLSIYLPGVANSEGGRTILEVTGRDGETVRISDIMNSLQQFQRTAWEEGFANRHFFGKLMLYHGTEFQFIGLPGPKRGTYHNQQLFATEAI